ncbi:hypothetical protein [Pedobacter panaciterrae]
MNLSRVILIVSLFFALGYSRTYAQIVPQTADSVVTTTYKRKFVKDPAFLARQQFVTDSIMTHSWLFPDSMVHKHMIMDSIIKANVVGRSNLISRYKELTTMKVSKYRLGKPVPKGSVWVLKLL